MIVKEEKQNNASGLLSLSKYDRETPDQHRQTGRQTNTEGQVEIYRQKYREKNRNRGTGRDKQS